MCVVRRLQPHGQGQHGLLNGHPTGGGCGRMPRLAGKAGKRNAATVAKRPAFVEERNLSSAQFSVAWVLAEQPTLVPVMGARTREQLRDVLGALEKPLSASDVAAVEILLPPDIIAGDRYRADFMKSRNSER